MQRRTFIQTLTALVATPALPVAAAPSAQITQHFARAKLLARCHDRASPEMFARLMKLDGDTARGVYDMLADRRVIARGADGIARAINPLNTHCVPNEAVRARDLAQMTSDLTKELRARVNKRLEAEAEPEEKSENETETLIESPENKDDPPNRPSQPTRARQFAVNDSDHGEPLNESPTGAI